MCGIAGFVNRSGIYGYTAETLSRVSDLLEHRGPDDLGFVLESVNGEVTQATTPRYFDIQSASREDIHELGSRNFRSGLMHRRLAIIQPGPEGHQPMSKQDGKVWISLNGEIYNYKALRLELESYGFVFETETDTEVVLQGYLYWGKSVVEHLDGMWSFAILDLRSEELWASVDRAGIKPFYYRSSEKGFFFASEIKAFSESQSNFTPNWLKINRFLATGKSDEDTGADREETMIAGIYRLKAGQQLTLDLNLATAQISLWYKREVNNGFDFQPYKKETARIEEIQDLLVEMIGLRLQSDVPLGVCLSGGIDSSTIAGLMAFADSRLKNRKPRLAFMAALPRGTKGDESGWARLMATHTGFDFHEVHPTADDFIKALDDFVYTMDEPAPGPNAFSQYAVFQKVASKGIKVTLDGQGADEIFAGYYQQQQVWSLEQIQAGNAAPVDLPWLAKMGLGEISNRLPAAHSMINRFKPGHSMFDPSVFDQGSFLPPASYSLNSQLENDFSSSTLPFLLKAADRNSMRWSIESRMPFADFEPLVAYMFQVEGAAKIQDGWSKYLLRKAAQPFVPQAILARRDKIGFAAPDLRWMQAIPDTLIKDLMKEGSSGWLHSRNFWLLWQRMKAGKPEKLQVLWRAVSVLLWLRRVVGQKPLL